MELSKVAELLNMIDQRLSNLERNITRIDEKLDFSVSLQRNHLIRIKNGQSIDDNMILMGRPYNDLSPKEAYQVYNNPNADFLIIDCSSKSFQAPIQLDGIIRIPLEELEQRIFEIKNKTIPILIISEQGLRSIQASELMVRHGFFNVNNVSGGYEFWKSNETKMPTA